MLEYLIVRIISSIIYITKRHADRNWLVDHAKRLEQFPSVQVFLYFLKSGSACSALTRAERLTVMVLVAIISKSEATRGARRWSLENIKKRQLLPPDSEKIHTNNGKNFCNFHPITVKYLIYI